MRRVGSLLRTIVSVPKYKFSTTTTNIQTNAPNSQLQKYQKYSEKISKHRTVYKLYDLQASAISEDVFIAPNATVVGDVTFGTNINIWHGAVLRGDLNSIFLDEYVTIGENCVLHTASNLPNGLPAELMIGKRCFIQPGCTLYSCEIGKNVFVGYNTVIMEGARIGDGVILDPNSVVPPGRIIPDNEHWGGNPIKFIREVEDRDKHVTRLAAQAADQKGLLYTADFLPYNTAYLLKENDLPEDQIQFRSHRSIYQTTINAEYDPRKTY